MLALRLDKRRLLSSRLCFHVMGQSEPVPSPTRAATPPLPHPDTIDASRTEIFFLAVGVLFLVLQLTLVIWFCAPRAFAPKSPKQLAIAWEPVVLDDHDDRPIRRRRIHLRRSSTWNGRAADQDGSPVRRRKSTDINKSAIVLSGSDPDSDSSDRYIRVRRGAGVAGFMAATLAMRVVRRSPRRIRSPVGSLEPESDGSSGGTAREMHAMPPSALLRPTLSPRSPRLGPIDQATREILKEERHKSETTPLVSPLVSPVVLDEKDLANGFDDPLGVNRFKLFFGDPSQGVFSAETQGWSDVAIREAENAVLANSQLQRRRRSSR